MAMQLGDLYNMVLLLIMVGILVGIGVLALDKLGGSTGITPVAQLAINGTRDAISPIGTVWMSLIVTISVLGIIMSIVLLSFGIRGPR